jgi:regulator of replication initiation timing
MTPKQSSEKLVPELLQSIDPRGIADPSLRQTIEVLLNLIEELNLKVKSLEEENQKLRDENNRLKGEKGKPDIKANKIIGLKKDHSSEKERKTPSKHTKSSKNANIQIDRERILEYPKSELPSDAEFKGYVREASRREEVIVQDILLKTDNVLFRKQKYYSVSEGKTYLAALPAGYDGEFGPGVKALVMSMYYGGNMTQGKLLEFLEDTVCCLPPGDFRRLPYGVLGLLPRTTCL